MATPAEQVNQGFTDAQGVNNSPRDTYIYKDFSLFFTPNPVSGDVTKLRTFKILNDLSVIWC